MESSELAFNDLPIEIITKILRFLKKFDLERAMFTCKM